MTESTAVNSNHTNRLKRYLHTGNEFPKYFPGNWDPNKYFQRENLNVVNEVLAIDPNNVEIVNIILKAYKDGWYTRFGTIAFALSKCILFGNSHVKNAAYKAASEMCNTPEEIMLFNKFTRLLKTGNGQGWCRFVKAWYNKKDTMELAKEVTRVRSRYGRSHKTLIRKSHIKVADNDHARDAVIKYAILGLKRAKQVTADKADAEGVKEVFEYIQKIEDLRHCEDPIAAALLVSQQNLTLDHIPGHLLTAQDVWDAILPQFTLEELLDNIQRIHNMGYLKNEDTTTAILVSLISNQEFIKKSKVTPLHVYITLCNYQKKGRPMKHEKQAAAVEKEQRRRTRQIFDQKTGVWEWSTNRRHPKEAKHWGIDLPPSPLVLVALNKLIDHTWLLTPPTGARYMITLDMRHHMFKGRHFCKNYTVPKKATKTSPAAGGDADTEKKSKKHLLAECFYNSHITPGHAAIILALQILKREKNVKLAVFSDDGVQIMNIERNFTNTEEAEFMLRKAELGCVQLDAPIAWANKNKYKADVFINMVDRTTRYMELDKSARGGRGSGGRFGPPPSAESGLEDHCPVRALQHYRNAQKLPNAKLIVLSLASHRVATTDGSHEGVLDIVGVDEHVPKLMDAFVLGQFS